MERGVGVRRGLPDDLLVYDEFGEPLGRFPKVLTRWADGTILVRINHSWREYFKGEQINCTGWVTVPILTGEVGNKLRGCMGCQRMVEVKGVGAIRLEILLVERDRRLSQPPNGRNL